jgi:hypothetical protein
MMKPHIEISSENADIHIRRILIQNGWKRNAHDKWFSHNTPFNTGLSIKDAFKLHVMLTKWAQESEQEQTNDQ